MESDFVEINRGNCVGVKGKIGWALIKRKEKRIKSWASHWTGHLPKMATLPNPVNADLARGFTVSQVAEKHNWTEAMVWSLALEGREDLERFKELGWGLRTWDQ
ncbi:MAG: hypothetical protein U9R02_03610 [Thermodesulfobacteriota bacterium]|nr:hypothetical protein [Thermodesulfobacteriota bacterium]